MDEKKTSEEVVKMAQEKGFDDDLTDNNDYTVLEQYSPIQV